MSATYVLPQVLVFQDFQSSPAAAAPQLQAHISGGNAQLVRYTQPDEQVNGLLGVFNPLDVTAYDWPSLAVGGLVDESYVQLYAQNALLKYYSASASVVSVENSINTVASNDDVAFVTSSGYPRNGAFYDRDVKVGDIVKLRFTPVDEDPVTFWSSVAGFTPGINAGSVSATSADADNTSGHSASASVHQVKGPWNAVEISAVSAATYDPFPTGQAVETYTVLVTQASSHGDFTTARLQIISASGLDNVASITPSPRGTTTNIGTHGATATFNHVHWHEGGEAESESAIEQGVTPDDLLVGQTWQIVATATVTAIAAPTANDTYNGPDDTTYVVTVTKGSKYASGVPQITVTTTTGIDVSGPTNVPSAAVAIPIGTHGTTVTFAGAGLIDGDRYYVPVTGPTDTAITTLVLGNTLPAAFIASATTADITLYILNPSLEISLDRVSDAPYTNYSMSASQITVNTGITAYDPTWTDDGTPLPLTLDGDSSQSYSTLYVTYRAWLPTLSYAINLINDEANLDTMIAGTLDPDNPLKWAVFKALSNSNGVNVAFTSVSDPNNTADWDAVLALIQGSPETYGLVPLTHDATIWDLYQGHVDDQSSDEEASWRVAWFSLTGLPTIPLVSAGSSIPGYTAATTTNGDPALATITSYEDQYVLVTVPAANAVFITNGVQPGDIVRAAYGTDGFGNTVYSEYIVSSVLTQETLVLLSGPGAAINSPSKIEIWRNLNATQEATAIAQVAGAFADRRIRAVWPDTINTAGTVQDGFHLCAALAGLRSGILPNQGMTNLAVAGFDAVPRTTSHFNQSQLNIMAGSGVWIVTQAPSGEIYTRHAVTTGAYDDINQREEMVTSNIDSISFQFYNTFAPYIGISNVTPSLLNVLNVDLLGLINTLQTVTNPLLGGQMGPNASILALRPSALLADRIICIINPDQPEPFNNLEVHLVVSTATSTATTTNTASTYGGVTTGVTTPTTTG